MDLKYVELSELIIVSLWFDEERETHTPPCERNKRGQGERRTGDKEVKMGFR